MKALCEKMTKELEISKEKRCALSQDLKVWLYELNMEFESSAKSIFLDLRCLFFFSYQYKSLCYCSLLSRLVSFACCFFLSTTLDYITEHLNACTSEKIWNRFTNLQSVVLYWNQHQYFFFLTVFLKKRRRELNYLCSYESTFC